METSIGAEGNQKGFLRALPVLALVVRGVPIGQLGEVLGTLRHGSFCLQGLDA